MSRATVIRGHGIGRSSSPISSSAPALRTDPRIGSASHSGRLFCRPVGETRPQKKTNPRAPRPPPPLHCQARRKSPKVGSAIAGNPSFHVVGAMEFVGG